MTNAQDLPEPTGCYADGCDRESELLLHVADDPWLGGDFCMDHARAIIESTPLILTCECALGGLSPAPMKSRGLRVLGGGWCRLSPLGICWSLTSRVRGRWCARSARAKGLLPRLRAFPLPSPLDFDGTESPSGCSGPRCR